VDENSALGRERFVAVFSGLGLGLLLGVIMGMSVSPVVATVLGALTTLLGAMLGLQGDAAAAEATDESALKAIKRRSMSGLRLGSFGVACVAGIFIGLFMRSNEVLAVSIKDLVNQYEAAGYDKGRALELAAYQKLGLVPEGRQVQLSDTQKAQSGSLFTGLAKINFCRDVSMERFGGDLSEVLKAYRRQNNDKLTRLADQIEAMTGVEQKKAFMTALEEVLCDYHNEIQKLSVQ